MTSITSEVPGEPDLSGRHNDPLGTLTLAPDLRIVPDNERASGGAPDAASAKRGDGAPHKHVYVPRQGISNLRRYLAGGDVLALGAAWGAEVLTQPTSHLGQRGLCAVVAVLATLAAMYRGGLYRSRVCALPSLEAVRVFTASIVGTVAFVVCGLLSGPREVAGPIEAGSAAVVVVLLLRWRFTRWVKARRSASNFLRTVLMVGINEDARGLWTLLSEEPELGYRIGGIVGQRTPGSPWEDLPHIAGTERIGQLAAQTGANGAIVVASALAPDERSRAMNQALLAGLHLQVWPGSYGFSSRRIRMAPVSGVPLLYVEPKRAAKGQLAVKRGADLVLALVLGVLTAPLVGLAALAIKLSDGSPVLHRSKRIGRDGIAIDVLKLRTMVPNASTMMVNVADLNERKGGPLFKATDDPRVTKLGHLLRATSIDELPQLWNVLNGTMSLVGPRPALVHEVEHFDAELCRRHEMRPGITGLWQVEARDNPSFSAYRRLDLSYVDDWSLGLDVAILASTAHEMVVRAMRTLVQLATRGRRETSTTTAPTPAEHAPQGELALSGELA
jgi:exopolysaccharide biosynthesis polyprenyl glycosylphosphotransferase